MNLPLELQILVCRGLTKAELKAVRLVCKSLDQAVTPFLFDEVFVTASYSDLEVADLVASRFGTYVKTITLSSVEYKFLSMKEFRQKIEPRTKTLHRINAHMEHAFEVYCRARTERLEINQSGELMARLCLVLNKAPNSRKMILTDYGNSDLNGRPTAGLSHEPLKEDDLCPLKVCSLSVSDHLKFHYRPYSPFQMTPNPFHIAMLAVSVTKSTITELAMIHHGEDDGLGKSYLLKDCFNSTARLSYFSTNTLQQMTRLRIRLSDEDGEPKNQQSSTGRPIAKALSSAVSLESLFIEGDYGYFDPELGNMTSMSTFLEGCRFPKLTSLVLTNMNSTEDELLSFLKTSPCLKHLTMEFFALAVGSWEAVAQRIHLVLQLKSVMLDMLSGGFGSEYSWEYSSKNNNLIEKFFLHNGENPFMQSAKKLWFEIIDDDIRYKIKKAQNSAKRYEMFG